MRERKKEKKTDKRGMICMDPSSDTLWFAATLASSIGVMATGESSKSPKKYLLFMHSKQQPHSDLKCYMLKDNIKDINIRMKYTCCSPKLLGLFCK